jgi:hypothetical protein
MNRKLPRWTEWIFRGRDAELGDIAEDSGRHGRLWLWRQWISML